MFGISYIISRSLNGIKTRKITDTYIRRYYSFAKEVSVFTSVFDGYFSEFKDSKGLESHKTRWVHGLKF